MFTLVNLELKGKHYSHNSNVPKAKNILTLGTSYKKRLLYSSFENYCNSNKYRIINIISIQLLCRSMCTWFRLEG